MLRTAIFMVALAIATMAAAQTAPSLFADRTIAGGVGRVIDLAFSSDGRLLAVAGTGGLAVWDAQSATPIRQVTSGSEPNAKVAFGGVTTVAVGSERGVVSVMSLVTGQIRQVAQHGRNAVTAVALAADGSMGASGDEAGVIQVWSPDGGGQAERLKEDSKDDAVVFIAFVSATTMVSITRELAVTTWDVPKRRSIRRGTLQLAALGRSAEYHAAHADATGAQIALASQYLARSRVGAAVGGPVRPDDLARTNVIVPYSSDSGIAGDPVQLGDFLAERLVLSPGGCFALFASNYRNQPRMHVWSLIRQGQDLVRQELPSRASAVALDPTGRLFAAAFPTGEVRTWRVSGATGSDCQLYKNAQSPQPQPQGSRIALGSQTAPLFAANAGFKVAVMGFEAGGVDQFVGNAVAGMVGGELSNSSSVVVIERAAVDAIVKEMQLQASGLTAADAVKVGRGLNAQKVVLGRVARFGQGTFVVSARVVNVETQQVEGEREVTCENCSEADLPAAVRALRQIIVP